MEHNYKPRAAGGMTYISRVSLLALCVHLIAGPMMASPASAQTTEALRQMTTGNWEAARRLTQASRDPVAATLYEWMLYRDKLTGLPFERVAHFIQAHPAWPNQTEMIATAERNMPDDYPQTRVIEWFQTYPPVTGMGLKRYLEAMRATGQLEKSRGIVAAVWPKLMTGPETQREILSTYSQVFTHDLNRRRLDYLLFQDDKQMARALAAMMGRGYPELAEARMALAATSGNAPSLLSRVPASLLKDPGLLYERLRYRRKGGDDSGAIEILSQQPATESITNLEAWWKERNILARRLIEERKYREAYQVASKHRQMEGQDYADAEWLSGWLALRFLKQPDKAYQHFGEMHTRVKSAISKARAAYWLGRSAEAMKKREDAENWYKAAAQYPKVYYGQLAALKLTEAQRIYRPMTVTTGPADKARLNNDELARAIKLAHVAGLDRMRRQLINAKVAVTEKPEDFKAFTEMLAGMGLRSEAVRVAKKAAGQNIFLDNEAYPQLKQAFAGLEVDKGLAHAVIRQESEFDQYARSSAGALGLMQLMPTTAAYVAKKRGWQHQAGWLTTRAEHNVLLGSAYLNQLLSTYNGSYPLVLAAYNAGGGRVNQWLRANGDPRNGDIDWVDWIELIPIYETRNYVQRVMESYVVYSNYMGVK